MFFSIYGHGGHVDHLTMTIWTNLRSSYCQILHMKFDWNWPSDFWGEAVWKCWQIFNQSDLKPRSLNDLGLWYSQRCMKHLLSYHTDYHCFGKIQCFMFSPFKISRAQIWPPQKIGQGQPRVTICINFVILSNLMLHTKFQGNQPSDSEEDDFSRF